MRAQSTASSTSAGRRERWQIMCHLHHQFVISESRSTRMYEESRLQVRVKLLQLCTPAAQNSTVGVTSNSAVTVRFAGVVAIGLTMPCWRATRSTECRQ